MRYFYCVLLALFSINSLAKISVFVTVPPIAYLLEQISEQNVEVDLLIQNGKDPHTYNPTPNDILKISKASLYFKLSLPFENEILNKVKKINTKLLVIDLSESIKQHQDDPHIWLSPLNLKIMAKLILGTLKRVDSKNAKTYELNYLKLIDALDAVHLSGKKHLSNIKNKAIYVFHSSLGYFLREYGLKQESVELGEGKVTLKRLNQIITEMKKNNIKTLFVQPQFDQKSSKIIIDSIKGNLVEIDPLKKDIISNFYYIISEIEKAYK